MEDFSTKEVNTYWLWYVDISGMMIVPISEMLAILPYLLRSLRIQKMFEAREIYCNEERIPKRMIWKWKDERIAKILVLTVIVLGSAVVTAGFMGVGIINYNTLSAPMKNKGMFGNSNMHDSVGIANIGLSSVNFCEYVLLCWAMHAQWYIE